ncbi:lipase 3-like [Bacillus rossius redtenbacheri]|uniref:lipase 3-like n=1 Tax=Bacillus rossius redtenbacheri TaxID=93214 RepID=UPI002FDDCBB0
MVPKARGGRTFYVAAALWFPRRAADGTFYVAAALWFPRRAAGGPSTSPLLYGSHGARRADLLRRRCSMVPTARGGRTFYVAAALWFPRRAAGGPSTSPLLYGSHGARRADLLRRRCSMVPTARGGRTFYVAAALWFPRRAADGTFYVAAALWFPRRAAGGPSTSPLLYGSHGARRADLLRRRCSMVPTARGGRTFYVAAALWFPRRAADGPSTSPLLYGSHGAAGGIRGGRGARRGQTRGDSPHESCWRRDGVRETKHGERRAGHGGARSERGFRNGVRPPAMRGLLLLLHLLPALARCLAAIASTGEPLYLTPAELCRRQARYVCESHELATADGYLLQVHRVRLPGALGPPVLLLHGIFMASDCWLLAPRGQSLGFLLADEGYDVWLGNLRGNAFARNHTRLSPEQRDFWTFTFHEMGVWDVPATAELVARARGGGAGGAAEPLRCVGHSMGATALLVACSERPLWCGSALRGLVLLAPGAFLSRGRSPVVRALLALHDRLWDVFYLSGQYEVLPSNRRVSRLIRMCDRSPAVRRLCEVFYDVTLGRSYYGINKTVALTFLAHVPAGSSLYTVDHFTQIMKSGEFKRYDRTISGRLDRPSTAREVSPYHLGRVTLPAAIHFSQADTLVDPEDVLELSRLLPNVVNLHKITDPKFDHLSFIAGNNVRELLYDQILADLRAM